MKYLIDASTIITNLIQQRPIYNLLINSFGSQNSFDPTPMFFNYVVKKKKSTSKFNSYRNDFKTGDCILYSGIFEQRIY